MFFQEILKLGLSNLRLHLLRSVLTALGIILGVSAVITMVSIGEGSKREALLQIERLGAKNIIIRSVKPPETDQSNQQRSFVIRYGLTRETLRIIASNFGDADAVVPIKDVGSQVLRGDIRRMSQAKGVTPALLNAAGLRLARGRYLTQNDLESTAMVGVLGH